MAEMALTFYGGFSPVGDFLVLAVCLVFIILFHTAYINRTLNFVIFRTSIYLLLFTAIMDIHYHMSIMLLPTVPDIMVYSLRIIVHFLLFSILTCYVFYIRETFNVKGGLSNIYIYAAFIALFLIPVLDLVISLTSGELTIRENGTVVNGITIFPMGYIFFVALIFVMIINNRSRIYKQVLLGACFSTLISIFIMIIQGILDTSSFTVASFLMPSIAILYLAHSTPYDLESGAVNITAFNDYVTNCYRQNKEILVMSLYLKAFDVKGKKFSEELQTLIRYYNHHFF
nr:hypothetical protein [Lachnospiraceae bacterium]